MSKLVLHAFPVEASPDDLKSPFLFKIKSHPIADPQSLSALNKGGFIKIYGMVDASAKKRDEMFLIVGTGMEIPKGLNGKVKFVGSVLLSDGRYGQHVLYVDNHSPQRPGLNLPDFKAASVQFYVDRSDDLGTSKISKACAKLVRQHQGRVEVSNDGTGDMMLTLIDPSFRDDPEFEMFMDLLYSLPAVQSVCVNKAA